MLAIKQIQYAPNGKPIGVDLNIVIELVKLYKISDPVKTIEKIMFLSNELIKNGN